MFFAVLGVRPYDGSCAALPAPQPVSNQCVAVAQRARVRRRDGGSYGLPTNVVTLWAAREALKRALATVIGLFSARLSLAEVTQGVTVQGAAPDRNKDIGVALVLLLIATTTAVPSVGFV
jgi:hypothetical protein